MITNNINKKKNLLLLFSLVFALTNGLFAQCDLEINIIHNLDAPKCVIDINVVNLPNKDTTFITPVLKLIPSDPLYLKVRHVVKHSIFSSAYWLNENERIFDLKDDEIDHPHIAVWPAGDRVVAALCGKECYSLEEGPIEILKYVYHKLVPIPPISNGNGELSSVCEKEVEITVLIPIKIGYPELNMESNESDLESGSYVPLKNPGQPIYIPIPVEQPKRNAIGPIALPHVEGEEPPLSSHIPVQYSI